ncbi:CPCC family cysteine-rich protein [Lysinibacillus sp. FN11]|uniref:CPCC family cysteine-rich protein n=1 Tax=Lysinibacillus sp. FN11 TaxID=2968499 RepID=UPI00214BAA39|nr:CPCC family cysteine-rich protein [Lysinibacillus sp. FN11]UUV26663.1 CPCC family cysteine-rich protein [Lysinibacillus sp. FN11]
MKNEENKTNQYLPSINYDDTTNCEHDIESDIVVGNSPCPCCEFITIPNNGEALAYICPVCFWEIDLFIQSNVEASDQNHGLTLTEQEKIIKVLGQYCLC